MKCFAIAAGTLSAALTCSTAGATEVYSTFSGDENALFDCCNVIPILGPKGGDQTVAIPFIASGDAHIVRITEIDLALSYGGFGPDRFHVYLEGPTWPNGHPHRMHHKYWTGGAPAGGQCCVFESISGNDVHIKTGGTYWVVVSTSRDGISGWNINSIGLEGPYETWDGMSWHRTSGPLPALRILAE